MILLVGKTSRLTMSLTQQLGSIAHSVSSRDLAWVKQMENAVAPTAIFCTSAITDPVSSLNSIFEANVSLPLKLADKFPNSKIITFGTIMELSGLSNPYIDSKRKLVEMMTECGSNFSHYRLHTLYGKNRPKSHMFLGHICNSIRNNSPLTMSSGYQRREYHHYTDVSKYVLDTHHDSPNIVNCSTGVSISLLDIINIIKSDVAPNLKVINDVSLDQNDETYTAWPTNQNFSRYSRPQLAGISTYIKKYIES